MLKAKVHILERISVIFLAFVIMSNPSLALATSGNMSTKQQLDFFSKNNIFFYDGESGCTTNNTMGNSDGSDVSMFGDSISVMSTNAIKAVLPRIQLDAISGTWINQGDNSGVSRISEAGELRKIVVVAMGTNGGVTNADIDAVVAAVNADGNSHEIILMTIYVESMAEDAFSGNSNMMSTTNSAVKYAASRYDNVSYADWAEAVKNAGSNSVIGDGHVHPSDPAGTELFAKTIQTAVNKKTTIDQVAVASQTEVTGTGPERVKSATKVYGEIAMRAQKTFGVPWEVLIAQMQIESNIGQSPMAIETNNWLGIRGTGDAGTYVTENNGRFAKFSSVEVSIVAWAGSYVMRNGYYDDAFQYLDPNNWDLHSYLVEVIKHYAPNSDGNNESAYVANIEDIIDTMVRPAREEMGWPSSEEYARQNNIPIGGMYPIGTEVRDELTEYTVCGQASYGVINDTALLLSWPDRTHSKTDPKPEYRMALEQVGLTTYGDSWVQIGASCDAFVTTVYRYTGSDPDFYCCGVEWQYNYFIGHPQMYKEIEDADLYSASNLLPGDILIDPEHHIELYVVENGVGKIASASYGGRTADHGINFYAHDSGYKVIRRL